MSALLNHNPTRNISWKGLTINQITSSIQKNKIPEGSVSKENIFRAQPLKIYRRETVANIPPSSAPGACVHSRISSSIDEYVRPGGSFQTTVLSSSSGLVNTKESPVPPTKQDTSRCTESANCAATNARRRCRSSGMIKKQFDPVRGDSAYFTNSSQYLTSRSKTFAQNQYRHVRYADASIVTASPNVTSFFSPNGLSHCPKATITDAGGANVFYYYWLDASGTSSTRYAVTIPAGAYDVHELNSAFESVMYQNHHYYIHNSSRASVYLMKIVYNSTENKVELQAFSSASVADTSVYTKAPLANWNTPVVGKVGTFFIPSTPIQNVVGFSTGYYPNISANSSANVRDTAYGILSDRAASLHPSYSRMTYKPSNNRFAIQGATSSSDMLVRKKYETITRNSLAYARAFGSQVGNAMSYGVADEVYTEKAKIGYPNKQTPVFDKYTGEMKCSEYGGITTRCGVSTK